MGLESSILARMGTHINFVLIIIFDGLYFYKTALFVIILIIAIVCYLIIAFLTSEFLNYPVDEEEIM